MACIAAAANFGAMAVRTPEALRRDGPAAWRTSWPPRGDFL